MKILFVHNGLSTFVQYDLDILKSAYKVHEISPDINNLKNVADAVAWCDVVFGWWASWHMVLPTIFAKRQGKKIVIVGGDYDTVLDPSGKSMERLVRDKLRKQATKFIFNNIDKFVTFSEYSLCQTKLLPFVDDDKVSMVYLGLPDLAKGQDLSKKNNILSVGRINRFELFRKGHANFVKTSLLLEKCNFILAGKWEDSSIKILKRWNSRNIQYLGYISREKLSEIMSKSIVYVQASYREGFGMALAEAMLFKCVPVVTNHGSIPEIVGDAGIYVPYGDPEATAQGIMAAISNSKDIGIRARERILDLYPLEKRRSKILELVGHVYA